METPSSGLKLFRLVFGGGFTIFGLWASARVVLELQAANASWPDWLILLFPAVPLALGLFSLVAAVRNAPDLRRPFVRHRTEAARVFGGLWWGFSIISVTIIHLFQQKTLSGVLAELAAAALTVGLTALLVGAINADVADQQRGGE
ncbi:MAG TPA: hypothetical protein VFI23_09690 [Rhizomicrobium sp.]|nr:hypothetical protein [Rhizomicrobium sp.]